MWQNPYAINYNPLAGLKPPGPAPIPSGQLNLNQFSSSGVITPPPNASPFPAQPNVYQPTSVPLPPDPSQLLQPEIAQQVGSMVVNAFENFKKSIVGHEEDGDDMILTVKIPKAILKSDQNFSFLFK